MNRIYSRIVGADVRRRISERKTIPCRYLVGYGQEADFEQSTPHTDAFRYLISEMVRPQVGARTVPVRSACADQGAREKGEIFGQDNPLQTGTVRGPILRDAGTGLNIMPFGNSQIHVPKGQLKIAQRFNAGSPIGPAHVPKGQLKGGGRCLQSSLWDSNGIDNVPGVKTPGYSRDVPTGHRASTFRTALGLNRYPFRRGEGISQCAAANSQLQPWEIECVAQFGFWNWSLVFGPSTTEAS